MSQPPLRLVHASDLHLENPLGGVAEVPDHLRDVFLNAPYLAAEQVFELAISEGADALLLAGRRGRSGPGRCPGGGDAPGAIRAAPGT